MDSIRWFVWLSPAFGAVAGGIMGALAAFILLRYVPPRRYLELLGTEEPHRERTRDGNLFFEAYFIVRFEGNEVQPLHIAEWIPKKRTHRTTLFKHNGRQKEQFRRSGQEMTGRHGNWSISTLNPPELRKGLWLYPGETVKLAVFLIVPMTLYDNWKDREIPGTILLAYGRNKSLRFDHAIALF
jgi:hypothetical protein